MFFLFITKRTARIIPITKRTATTIPTAPPAFDWTGDVAMMYLGRMQVITINDVPDGEDDNNVNLNNFDDDE